MKKKLYITFNNIYQVQVDVYEKNESKNPSSIIISDILSSSIQPVRATSHKHAIKRLKKEIKKMKKLMPIYDIDRFSIKLTRKIKNKKSLSIYYHFNVKETKHTI